MISVLLWFLKLGLGLLVLITVLLFIFQAKIIYHPRPYRADYARLIPPRGVEIEYNLPCGKQTAFYIPPKSADDPTTVPQRLWMMFGGNGSLALFWSETVRNSSDPDAAFLLVDYPGYGKCDGKPSPVAIQEGSEAALSGLARFLKTSPSQLETDLNVGGHSLGAAAALQFAVRHSVKRAVLVAPFTTMREMAREVVGRFFALLLTHQYDNRARLAELGQHVPLPRITILHGDADPVIPIRMSRELAAAFPGLVTLHEIQGADHVTVLDAVGPYLDDETP